MIESYSVLSDRELIPHMYIFTLRIFAKLCKCEQILIFCVLVPSRSFSFQSRFVRWITERDESHTRRKYHSLLWLQIISRWIHSVVQELLSWESAFPCTENCIWAEKSGPQLQWWEGLQKCFESIPWFSPGEEWFLSVLWSADHKHHWV